MTPLVAASAAEVWLLMFLAFVAGFAAGVWLVFHLFNRSHEAKR